MLENISDGEYLKLKISNFEMDNVDAYMEFPIRLMKAFSNFLVEGAGIAKISSCASECEFDLILSTTSVQGSFIYIVNYEGEINNLEVKNVVELAKELLLDMKNSIHFWIGRKSKRKSVNMLKKEIVREIKDLEKNIKNYEQIHAI